MLQEVENLAEDINPTVNYEVISENRGVFAVEPLGPGYGTTLGNPLRRVLLSSLPGAAVTTVKIDGVQHEFSTIPHMKEDVLEFLLNVKGIRLRYLSERSDTLHLEASGEGEVCARDIKPSAVFEIINPDHHLATLESPEAKLDVELTVEIGEGYVIAPSASGQPIGVLPVDAVFTPIRNVNYRVEKTRIGHRGDYDRLILDVSTDGTVPPEKAVVEAAQILSNQFGMFEVLGRPREEEAVAGSGEGGALAGEADIPLDQLELSLRTMNALRRAGITTVGMLMGKSKKELLNLSNFGPKSWDEVQDCLGQAGLTKGSEGEAAAGEESETEEMKEMRQKLQEKFPVRRGK